MSLLQSALNKLRGEQATPASPSPTQPAPTADVPAAEMTQRFAQFLMMQAQQIMLVLGLSPSPYGQMPPQLPEAKMLIDQLEMLRVKTAGNLSRQETALLDKMIDQCCMAFTKASGGTPPSLMPSPSTREIPLDEIVGTFDDEEEEVSSSKPHTPAAPASPKREPQPAAPRPASSSAAPTAATPQEAESKKKFVKSYGSF